MSRPPVPKVDARRASDLLQQLRAMAPHYTREWPARDDADPGVALLKIFSSIAEGVISRLNRAPDRNFLAFLDMLGIRLLPKTPASAPVRFLVATGTEDPFLIKKKTQVSAAPTAEHPDELPFETTKDLLAIPAALTSLVAVDPEKDRIYAPPPSFLGLQLAATELPQLIVQAFSSSGSQVLQLDPPGQVAEGDFLRIEQSSIQTGASRDCLPANGAGQSRLIDHLIVSASKGTIVTVTEPLARDHAEGTPVSRVTRFELFEGKDFQEHILLLAHADYFAIKSEAKIELQVDHSGSFANLSPMKIVWEFFGVTDVPKTEDGWQPLEVQGDDTVGLSRPGKISLRKPAGEIKETEIDGCKSRWIRARLKDPLPATPPPSLPRVESITLKTSSGGSLGADEAFNNDTPLTLAVPFFPFGTEPRIFDRFSIASEEAFSKPGAEIILDFTLDPTDLLAAPTAVSVRGKIRAFAHAAAGRLIEFEISSSRTSNLVRPHDTPVNTRITSGSTPATVIDAKGERVGVFIKADDGKIYLRYLPGDAAAAFQWIDLQAPGKPEFNPAAIRLNDTWHLFVIANQQLFTRAVDSRNPSASPGWVPLEGSQLASTPFPVIIGDRVAVYVTDDEGKTWLFDTNWVDITPRDQDTGEPIPEFLADAHARPFAARDEQGVRPFRVFLRNRDKELVAFEFNQDQFNFGSPPTTKVDSDPSLSVTPTGNRAYVRGADNLLWSIDADNFAQTDWSSHLNPSEAKLGQDPFVLVYRSGGGDFVSVFSTSDKNMLLEFRARGEDVDAGQLQAGPRSILMLQFVPQLAGTYYIRVTDGPGADSDADAVRRISNALSFGKFAVLERPLHESATTETRYELFQEQTHGDVQAATSDTLELEAGAGALVQDGDFIFVRNQLRRISDAPDDDTIEVDEDWDETPDGTDTYYLLRFDQTPTGRAQFRSAPRAKLAAAASDIDNAYKDFFIEVTDGTGASPNTIQIKEYFGDSKNVVLDEDFNEPPDQTSKYRITISSLEEGWFTYQDPNQTELRPKLSWEYWNGRGFVALAIKHDGTQNFLFGGKIEFQLPEDVGKTEVAGQENYWIRARIIGGDYGRELFTVEKDNQIKLKKDPIRPPIIRKLEIFYSVSKEKPPQFCLTLNNLNYLDQTAANLTPNKYFLPYQPLIDSNKALYLGFDRAFEGGPVRVYFAAKELPVEEQNRPKLNWEFAFENDWAKLFAADDTKAFTRPGSVGLNVPSGFQNSQRFGKALFWIRATLVEGVWSQSPLLAGVFPNTVETVQARTILNEILGSSDSTANQHFKFTQLPVLEGEEIRVRESLTEQEYNELVDAQGEDVVLAVRDQEDRIMETWIKWREVQEFFDSGPGSRDYRLDRASGDLEFGDNIHGRIPPAGGDNIVAFAYQAGGGIAGNVAAGEINSPVTAVAGVDSVINPMPAGGGSEGAAPEDMLKIGPAQIANRGRAVTVDDFENLAVEASREVAKARCLPNRNADGRHEIGWTSIHVVPYSKDKKPQPSLELRRAISRYLTSRADLTLIDEDHLFVGAPEYVPVNIDVTVYAKSLDEVAAAELNVRQKLEEFLHPLTGGVDGTGWDFGRDLAASDIYRLLEDIDQVDHIEKLRLSFGDAETVEVGNDALVASGAHTIRMDVAVK